MTRLVTTSTCTHLRHKGMYVMSVPDPSADDHGSYDATAFWCTCTQKATGPDGQPVHPDRCVAGSGRACCVN